MGAFGLNASTMDSANLAWRLGLCARGRAQLSVLGPTYDTERRLHARRIIRVTSSCLRFVCNSKFPLAQFTSEEERNPPNQPRDAIEYTAGHELQSLQDFFSTNGQFLLGVDAAYPASCISSARTRTGIARHSPIAPRNGVRAPNPRVCFSTSSTGYLYDALTSAATIHIVFFASDLQGPVRRLLAEFSSLLRPPTKSRPSFYHTHGAASLFNIVLVTKCLPHEAARVDTV
jgi:phenol 2-monooxygenase (NADPH)